MTESFERLRTALADRYQLQREVGAGGMATVYLADDLRHGRPVAVKVLRPEIASALGPERFLREIRITARLNHPRVLPLLDSGQADGQLFYVMPYVEGESLRDRLQRDGQLPLEDSLAIARAVGQALAYAHSFDTVHRDIKPANILLSSGEAVVADFGIARAISEAGGTKLTESGMAVGTVAYMSPEQAAGDRMIDGRSDVYALGCVLYEMLAGEPPYTGPSMQAITAKKLTEPVPSLLTVRDTVSPSVEAVVRKALARAPADRYQTAQQFVDALSLATTPAEGVVISAPGLATEQAPAERGWRGALPWAVVAVLVVVMMVLMARSPSPDEATAVTRLVVDAPPGYPLADPMENSRPLAVSPDGRRIAFAGWNQGEREFRVFLRDLDAFETVQLPGTEGGRSPFFSPDGEWVAYFDVESRRLEKVPVRGGRPQVVCDCLGLSGSWGPDDMIVIDHVEATGLRRVSADGGEPEFITSAEAGEPYHSYPQVLPGGKAILFQAWGSGGTVSRIAVFSLETNTRTTLIENGLGPRYVESGYLVYARAGELWAVPFDVERLELQGTPVPVLDSVYSVPPDVAFDVSRSETLAYLAGAGHVQFETRLMWVDRSGAVEELNLLGNFWGPRLSPDGRRVVLQGAGPGEGTTTSVWVWDLRRGTLRRFTDEQTDDYWPVWTLDGRRIVFNSYRGGGSAANLHVRPADGSGVNERIGHSDSHQQPYSWEPDGETLLFQENDPPRTGFDIWRLTMEGGAEPERLIATGANETHPALSPEGRWLAYTSDESGREEVYVTRYPELDGRQQVSTDGGIEPAWSSEGGELFYRSMDGTRWFAVSFVGGPGEPRLLFEASGRRGFVGGMQYGRNYDVTADGSRFITLRPEWDVPSGTEFRVVVGWGEELERTLETER